MMKIIISFAFIFCFLISNAIADEGPAEAFKNYRVSTLSGNGEAAILTVNSATIKYFDFVLESALNADSAKVDSMKLIDKFMTLTIRYLINPEEIKGMDGKALFKYAVAKKLIAREEMNKLEIKDIALEGDIARGQVAYNGKATPYFFYFQKEGGIWKLDLMSIFEMTNFSLEQAVKQSGMSANDFIIFALHYSGDHKPDANIWKPLN